MLKDLGLILAAASLVAAAVATGCSTEVVDPGAGTVEGLGNATCGVSCSASCSATCSTGCDLSCSTSSCASCSSCSPSCASCSPSCASCSPSCSSCFTSCSSSCSDTPLVLAFDDAPVAFVAGADRAFALSATQSVVTDWPTAATPWLALDRDANGKIDDGGELFGSATRLASGALARNGFEALRELDTNGDGRITPEDAGFARLRLWADRDGDRASAPGELSPLAARGIVAIDLRYDIARRCDARGNCEVERARFEYVDEGGVHRTGAVIDVHLARRGALGE